MSYNLASYMVNLNMIKLEGKYLVREEGGLVHYTPSVSLTKGD